MLACLLMKHHSISNSSTLFIVSRGIGLIPIGLSSKIGYVLICSELVAIVTGRHNFLPTILAELLWACIMTDNIA